MVSDGCKGKDCDYYRRKYKTQKLDGGELPIFDLPTDEFCAHPDTYKPSDKIKPVDRTGTPLQIIKNCPHDTKNS